MALSDDGTYRETVFSTGFANNSLCVVSYNSTTRKITLSGTVQGYYNGEPITELVDGWQSPAHADVAGVYYLYYDGEFKFNTTPWSFEDLIIAWVLYDGSKIGLRDVHGFMNPATHFNIHSTIGAYKYSGGSFSNYTLSSTTATNRRPQVSETVMYDEDCPTTIPALTTNAYCIRSLTGANTRTFTVDQAEIIPVSGSQPYWNEYSGGTWNQTLMSNNYYAAIFVAIMPVANDTTSQKHRFLWVQPQTESASLETIQALTPSSLSLGDASTLAQEYVFIGKIIIRYTGGNWTLTSVQELSGTKVSQVATSPAPTVASNVAFTPSGNIEATNVQTAIE